MEKKNQKEGKWFATKTFRTISGWICLVRDIKLRNDTQKVYDRVRSKKNKKISIVRKLTIIRDYMKARLKIYKREADRARKNKATKEVDQKGLDRRVNKVQLLLQRIRIEMTINISLSKLGVLMFIAHKIEVVGKKWRKELDVKIFERIQQKTLKAEEDKLSQAEIDDLNTRGYPCGKDGKYEYIYSIRPDTELHGRKFKAAMQVMMKGLKMEGGELPEKFLGLLDVPSMHISKICHVQGIKDSNAWKSIEAKAMFAEGYCMLKDVFENIGDSRSRIFVMYDEEGKQKPLNEDAIYDLRLMDMFGEGIAKNPKIVMLRKALQYLGGLVKKADASSL